jgi:hypothetical protein
VKWVALAVFGGLICTVGDHLHATHGVLTYPHVLLWDQAWWVFPLFAAASLVCVVGAWPFVKAVPVPDARRIVTDGIGFFAAYAYTSFAPADHPTVTLAVLVIAFGVRVLGERRAPSLIAYCVALAIAGSAFEAALSSTGAFAYVHPDLVVPRWLPGIYLHAGLVAGELGGSTRCRPRRSPIRRTSQRARRERGGATSRSRLRRRRSRT